MGTEELGESYLRSQIIPEFIDSFLVVLLEVPSLLHLLIVMKGIEDDGVVLYVQLKVHFLLPIEYFGTSVHSAFSL
jgi:hypothetical protein